MRVAWLKKNSKVWRYTPVIPALRSRSRRIMKSRLAWVRETEKERNFSATGKPP
jgi:hypothetical protein